MPVEQIIDVVPNRLMRGDWFAVNGVWQHGTVVSTDVKQRYAYVTTSELSTPIRLKLDETVRVSRVVPTEEEIAAQVLEHAVRAVAERFELAKSQVIAGKQSLLENLDIKDSSWHGRYWERFARAQMELAIWERVETVAKNHEITLIEATVMVRDDIVKQFIRRHTFTGRSSSALSNHIDATNNEVTADWVRELEFVLP